MPLQAFKDNPQAVQECRAVGQARELIVASTEEELLLSVFSLGNIPGIEYQTFNILILKQVSDCALEVQPSAVRMGEADVHDSVLVFRGANLIDCRVEPEHVASVHDLSNPPVKEDACLATQHHLYRRT